MNKMVIPQYLVFFFFSRFSRCLGATCGHCRLGAVFFYRRRGVVFIYVRAIQMNKVYPISDKNQINDR